MKILVCISSVPDTTAKINFTADGKSFDKNGVQFVINPHDEFSLNKAVELQEKQGATVTILTVGDATVDPVMRKALAIGANDGIRIDADARDDFFVATQIAKAAKDGGFDLVLTGKESIDYNGAQVAALLGELLDLPSVSIAKKLDIQGNEAKIDREIEGGKEVLTVSLPVVVGTAEGVAEAKIPNIRHIMGARSKPLLVVEPVEVKVLSNISRFESPAPRGTVKLAEDVDQLVQLLHNEAKVI